MWGRDKNFQVSMMYKLLNREYKISLIIFFFVHPLSLPWLGMLSNRNKPVKSENVKVKFQLLGLKGVAVM